LRSLRLSHNLVAFVDRAGGDVGHAGGATAASNTCLEDEEQDTQASADEVREAQRLIDIAYAEIQEVSKTHLEHKVLFEEWMKDSDNRLVRMQSIYNYEADVEGPLLDPLHHLRVKHAALILVMLMFQWDHIDRMKKTLQVSIIRKLADRLRERKLCRVRCLVCHFAKTIAEGDTTVATGRDLKKVKVTEDQVRSTLQQIAVKLDRCNDQRRLCCGTPHVPGRASVCLHRPAMAGWLQQYEKNWSTLSFRLDRTGQLTARQFFLRIMTQWDHILVALKKHQVSRVRDLKVLLAEIQNCQLLCPFCHHIKTYLMRDMLSWSYLPHALQPYTARGTEEPEQDVGEGAAAAEQGDGEGSAASELGAWEGAAVAIRRDKRHKCKWKPVSDGGRVKVPIVASTGSIARGIIAQPKRKSNLAVDAPRSGTSGRRKRRRGTESGPSSSGSEYQPGDEQQSEGE
jgi:hypothetical protein